MSLISRLTGSFWFTDRGAEEEPGLVQNEDGSVTVIEPDGTRTQLPGGNGGSSPVQAIYSGNAVTIADTETGNLTLDNLDSGTELLDRTSPGLPVFLEAGTYALTCAYYSSAPLTAGGYTVCQLATDGLFPAETTFHPELVASISSVVQVVALSTFSLGITNKDGAASRNFTLYALCVVKLA